MYSHDTFGLGHIRRTLLIAEHLTKTFPEISTLIISGSSMIHSMRIPSNIDYIKIPCLTKNSDNQYLPKYLTQFPSGVNKMRKEIIFNTLKEYHPDFLIVDKTPVGAAGELIDSLYYLRDKRPGTKIILGLRDILDSPDHIRNEWERAGLYDVVDECYDEIWVYGSRYIYDLVEEYEFPPSVAGKVHFCGYLRRHERVRTPEETKDRLGIMNKKMVLMTLGGGGDGHDIVEVFIKTISELSHQREIAGLIVTGPDFPNDLLNSIIPLTGSGKGMIVKDYTLYILDYMYAADLIVSMSGYNTVCEILSLNKKAIVVPRVIPRTEQLIRAIRFSEIGLLKVITPRELSLQVFKDEVVKALSSPLQQYHPSDIVDFNGLESVERRFRTLMNGSSPPCSLSESMKKAVMGAMYRSGTEGDIRGGYSI